jgi:hypothetical protein
VNSARSGPQLGAKLIFTHPFPLPKERRRHSTSHETFLDLTEE